MLRHQMNGFVDLSGAGSLLSRSIGRAGVWALCLILTGPLVTSVRADDQAERPPVPMEAIRQAESLSTAFKYVARSVSPAVVHITSVQRVATSDGAGGMEDELLRRFFGAPPGGGAPNPRERRGSGSGVIVSHEGHIVTNNHVVANADEIRVRLADGRELPAEIVGTDPETDIAVIRVEADRLASAPFGDSEVLEPGDWVVAIGNPFGLSHTVTSGIVSAIGRADIGLTTFENFIQTDAAINPGNSGGPLLNLRGEVVGINTAISTRSGGNQGIGFAVPASTVTRVMEGLLSSGRVERGWLGIVMQPMNSRIARALGIDLAEGGVLISGVVDGGPADEAGLRPQDVVRGLDGKPVRTQRELLNAVGDRRPGEVVAVDVQRGEQRQTLRVALGTRPPADEIAGAVPLREPPARPRSLLGMTVQPLTPAIRRNLRLEAERGLVVTNIDEGSEAASAGIAVGDVILDIAGEPAERVEQLRDAIDGMDAERGLLVRVQRGSVAQILVLGGADPS